LARSLNPNWRFPLGWLHVKYMENGFCLLQWFVSYPGLLQGLFFSPHRCFLPHFQLWGTNNTCGMTLIVFSYWGKKPKVCVVHPPHIYEGTKLRCGGQRRRYICVRIYIYIYINGHASIEEWRAKTIEGRSTCGGGEELCRRPSLAKWYGLGFVRV